MLVGALNTLKVSVAGIFLTTILGTAAGIARLSNNWLVSNLAKWYVDFFRNTPLLLQLFFIYFGVILLFRHSRGHSAHGAARLFKPTRHQFAGPLFCHRRAFCSCFYLRRWWS
ncbi:MAG: ABC transporter permease subunit [Chloroflexi bacterium]|nr:ABC transporter permease subunit [Chloroflexota bacterium]